MSTDFSTGPVNDILSKITSDIQALVNKRVPVRITTISGTVTKIEFDSSWNEGTSLQDPKTGDWTGNNYVKVSLTAADITAIQNYIANNYPGLSKQ